MGTTLTGTTPQDTYDSLIKVTNNGPLSSTARYLSDGLGNDSALALSTGNIGIGTTSPSRNLHILGGAGIGTVLKLEAGSGAVTYLQLAYNGATNAQSGYISYDSSANMGLFTNDNEKVRITSAGNVGIGTSSPAQKLDVAGRVKAAGDDYHTFVVDQGSAQLRLERTGTSTGVNYIGSDNRGLVILDSSFGAKAIFTANGLTFNGDTAAANALDDYEEGTFTPTFVGATITGGNIRGSYTKIGRQVYITVQFVSATISSAGGSASVQSLPFTCNSLYFGVVSIAYCDALTSTNASGWVDTASTSIVLMDGTGTSNANYSNGSNNRSIMINAVYQV